MDAGEASQDRFLLVICPGCKEPLYPEDARAGSNISCPQCKTVVPVPKPAQAKRPKSAQAPSSPPAVNEYGIHDADFVATAVEYIKVACPLCGTLLYAEPELLGKRITCPDCGTQAKVRRVERAQPKVPRPDEIGQYRVLDDGEATHLSPDDYFRFACPKCGTHMQSLCERAGGATNCPDCRLRFKVPAAPPRRAKKPLAAITDEAVSSEMTQGPPLREPVQPEAIANRIPLARPPRWTFFSGVFGFPWRDDALPRWGALAMGAIVVALLAKFALSFLADQSIAGQVLAVLFGLPALLLLGLGLLAFSAAVMLAVAEETAAGGDEIAAWPEPIVAEWIVPLVQVGYLLALAVALGHGAGWALGYEPAVAAACSAVASWMFFPLMLISALEAESAWLPFSGPIWRSLVRRPIDWLTFYAVSAVVVLAPLGIVTWGVQRYPTAMIVLCGPLLAAAWLIYARLIGRLAWKIARA